MNNGRDTITSEKLLETIGLQTVELNIHKATVQQLQTENQRLQKELEQVRKENPKPVEAA